MGYPTRGSNTWLAGAAGSSRTNGARRPMTLKAPNAVTEVTEVTEVTVVPLSSTPLAGFASDARGSHYGIREQGRFDSRPDYDDFNGAPTSSWQSR
jgi:hypothetical protein